MLLPQPYPDELFYSVIARFADRMGLYTIPAVARLAFGLDRVKPTIEVPPRLDKLLPRLLPHSPYTPDALVADYSLVPYFTAFMDEERARHARDAVLAADALGAFGRLCINTIQGRLTLLFCEECVVGDRDSGREPYWRRCHNLPGVCICLEHGSSLREGPSVRGNESAGFVSIERMLARKMPICTVAVGASPETLRAIAAASAALLDRPEALRGGDLVPAFFARLRSSGWAYGKRVASTKLFAAVTARLGPDVLADIGVHHNSYNSNTDSRSRGRSTDWLAAGLRARGRVTHPLPYILLLAALDIPVAELLSCSAVEAAVEPRILDGPCGNVVCPAVDLPVPRPLPGITGEGPFTIRCPNCGFTYRQSPQATPHRSYRIVNLGPLWDEALRRECRAGDATMSELKTRLGFSKDRIKGRALHLGIWHPRWGERTRAKANERNSRNAVSRREEQRGRYRARWLDMVARAPDAGRRQIGRLDEVAYAFLRMHDADWLEEVTPRVLNYQEGAKRDVIDDAALAALIGEVADDIRAILPPKRVSKASIARALGKTDLHFDFSRLPESVSLLRSVTETRTSFFARRRQWSDDGGSASQAVI